MSQGRRCVLKDCSMIADNTILASETVVPSFAVYKGSPGVHAADQPTIINFNLHIVPVRVPLDCQSYRPFVAPGILSQLSGIAEDDTENLLVVNARDHSLVIFTPHY